MKITDDRGSHVEMREISFVGLRSGNPFPRLVSLRADVERKSDPKVVFSETLGLMFVAAIFLVIGGFTLRVFAVVGVPAMVLGIALLAAGITRRWTIRREAERSHRRFCAVWNQSPLCLGCEYELRDIPPEPDGCTVCPECGAAWRVEPARPESHQSAGHRSDEEPP